MSVGQPVARHPVRLALAVTAACQEQVRRVPTARARHLVRQNALLRLLPSAVSPTSKRPSPGLPRSWGEWYPTQGVDMRVGGWTCGSSARRPARGHDGWMNEPAPADVLLADGRVAVMRPLRAEDAEALHDLHDRVSDDALRLRFFSASRQAAHSTSTTCSPRRRSPWSPRSAGGSSPSRPRSRSRDDLRGGVPGRRRDTRPGRRHAAARAPRRARPRPRHHPPRGGRAARTTPCWASSPSRGFESASPRTAARSIVELDDRRPGPRSWRSAPTSASSGPRPRRWHRCSPGSVAVVGVRSDGTGIGAAVLRAIGTAASTAPSSRCTRARSEILGVPAYAS